MKIARLDFDEASEAGVLSEHGTGQLLEIDFEYFQQFIDDPTIDEEQKWQLIESVWSIVNSVMDLMFGTHPVQHALEAGSQSQTPEQALSEALILLIAMDPVVQKEIKEKE